MNFDQVGWMEMYGHVGPEHTHGHAPRVLGGAIEVQSVQRNATWQHGCPGLHVEAVPVPEWPLDAGAEFSGFAPF